MLLTCAKSLFIALLGAFYNLLQALGPPEANAESVASDVECNIPEWRAGIGASETDDSWVSRCSNKHGNIFAPSFAAQVTRMRSSKEDDQGLEAAF